MKFDLADRTARLGEKTLILCKSIPQTTITRPLLGQLVRSATSVGANYMEADSAASKKDFLYKISLCKKETKETMHWLRMMANASPPVQNTCRELWIESRELARIFSSISKRKN